MGRQQQRDYSMLPSAIGGWPTTAHVSCVSPRSDTWPGLTVRLFDDWGLIVRLALPGAVMVGSRPRAKDIRALGRCCVRPSPSPNKWPSPPDVCRMVVL